MNEICTDNRFEIIEKAKKHIIESTNISESPEEMKILDNILFRCWQMGWLDRYNFRDDGIYLEFFAMKDNIRYNNNIVNLRDASKVLTNSLIDGIEKLTISKSIN